MFNRLSASISGLWRPLAPSAGMRKAPQAQAPHFARINAPGYEAGKRVTLRQVSPLYFSPLDDDFASAPQFMGEAARAGFQAGRQALGSCKSLFELQDRFGECYRTFANSEESGERRREFASGLTSAVRELQDDGPPPWGHKQDLIVGDALVASKVSEKSIGGDAYAGRIMAACESLSDMNQLRTLLSSARMNKTTPLSEEAQLAVMKKVFDHCAVRDRSSCLALLMELRCEPDNALCMWTFSDQVNDTFAAFEARVNPFEESLGHTDWADPSSIQAALKKWCGKNPETDSVVLQRFLKWAVDPAVDETVVFDETKVLATSLATSRVPGPDLVAELTRMCADRIARELRSRMQIGEGEIQTIDPASIEYRLGRVASAIAETKLRAHSNEDAPYEDATGPIVSS